MRNMMRGARSLFSTAKAAALKKGQISQVARPPLRSSVPSSTCNSKVRSHPSSTPSKYRASRTDSSSRSPSILETPESAPSPWTPPKDSSADRKLSIPVPPLVSPSAPRPSEES